MTSVTGDGNGEGEAMGVVVFWRGGIAEKARQLHSAEGR
jgi:hypothetical protein